MRDETFADALLALRPDPGLSSDLFAPLLGSWDLEVTWFDEHGAIARLQPGEWHFSRVLEGRAIQDVWIVPPRVDRPAGQFYEYGTSLRFALPDGTWRSLWIGPMQNSVRSFVARRTDGGIRLDTDPGAVPRLRWEFVDLTKDSFEWRNLEIGNRERLIQRFKAWRCP